MLPVVEIPLLCKGQGASGRGLGWVWQEDLAEQWVLPRLLWRPQRPPNASSSLPHCPPAPPGQTQEDHGAHHWCSHRKRGVSKYSRRAAAPRAWQRLGGHSRQGGAGRAAQVSRDKYCPLFLLGCRDQQTDELQIIIIILLLIHIPTGGGWGQESDM